MTAVPAKRCTPRAHAAALAALPLLLLASSDARAQSAARITLDPNTTYQPIVGWEADAQAGQFSDDTGGANYAGYRDQLMTLAARDLGLTRLRLEVPAGVEGQGLWGPPVSQNYDWINDNNDPNTINWNGFNFARFDGTVTSVVLPFKAAVEANGGTFFLNVTYVHFNSPMQDTFANSSAEYAEFVLALHLHLRNAFGLHIDTWEMSLEPEHDAPFTGQSLGNAMVAAGVLLKANGFSTKFIAPSCTDMGNAITYYDQLIAVPGAKALLSEFSYHRYAGVSDANLLAIAQRATRDQVHTSMLEHIGSDVDDLYKDLSLAQNSAWQQYVLAFPGTTDNGDRYFGVANPNTSQPTAFMMSRTKLLRQYFKFVRPGAVLYSATSNNGNFAALAFTNLTGLRVVVVKAAAAGSFDIAGLPAGRYKINYSTQSAYDQNLPDQTLVGTGKLLTTSIPAMGVITIYSVPTPAPVPAGSPMSAFGLALLLLAACGWAMKRLD